MAKPLTKQPPSSSVANMLDMGVGAAALAPPPRGEPKKPTPISNEILPPRPTVPLNTGEPADINRQFILTSSTDETLKKIIEVYSKATGIDLKASELMRAVLIALEHARPELEREATHIGRLKRPKNQRGYEGLRDQIERQIARAIIAGMRAATVLEG